MALAAPTDPNALRPPTGAAMLEGVYDVAVVGAGPAGSAAALAAARRGARVLLLDRQSFPRDKACGDGIAPQVLAVLGRLGVTGVADGYRPIPRLRLAGPGGDEVARTLSAAVHTIPRTVFDHRLQQAAIAAGATFLPRAVRHLRVDDDQVFVDDLPARVVIGADGASSLVRRHLAAPANPAGHLAIAIRGYAPVPPGAPHEQRIVMTGQHWPAYAWSFPIGDGRRNVGYGEMLRGAPTSRAHLLDRLAALLPDVDLAATTGMRAHHLPLSSHRPVPGRGRLLLAGDALSLINPFTGEGIFYAVLSGALAGAAAAREAADGGAAAAARYRRALRGRLGRHLRHTTAAAWLCARPWVVDAGVRAARTHRPVFDTLVDLGLGDGRLTARLLTSILAEGVRAAAARPGAGRMSAPDG
jgi:menaquinone-9 beta-reductase